MILKLCLSFCLSGIITLFLVSDLSKNYFSYGQSMHIENVYSAFFAFISGSVMIFGILSVKRNHKDKVPEKEDDGKRF